MDIVMGGVAALVAGAYVCRFEMMHARTTRAVVIAAHLAGFGPVLWAMVWALASREPGPLGWAAVVLAGAWIAATWPQWRHGVPSWARRRSC